MRRPIDGDRLEASRGRVGTRGNTRASCPRGTRPQPVSSSGAAVPVLAGLRDELLEEREVLALLGEPQDAEREPAPGFAERLDRPVLGPRDRRQPLPQPAEALVVVRLHGRSLAEGLVEAA